MGNPILFILLSIVAVGAALGMLLSHNAVHSALYLVLNFCTIAVFYIVLNAPFIAMVQVTVYAGAIVVLFLFVIMLLGAERLSGLEQAGGQSVGAIILAIVLAGCFFVAMGTNTPSTALPAIDSSPTAIGTALFERFVFPFEVTSILLLVAMMSLVVWQSQKRRK